MWTNGLLGYVVYIINFRSTSLEILIYLNYLNKAVAVLSVTVLKALKDLFIFTFYWERNTLDAEGFLAWGSFLHQLYYSLYSLRSYDRVWVVKIANFNICLIHGCLSLTSAHYDYIKLRYATLAFWLFQRWYRQGSITS